MGGPPKSPPSDMLRVPEQVVPFPVISFLAMSYLQKGRTLLRDSPDLLAFLGYSYAVAGKRDYHST